MDPSQIVELEKRIVAAITDGLKIMIMKWDAAVVNIELVVRGGEVDNSSLSMLFVWRPDGWEKAGQFSLPSQCFDLFEELRNASVGKKWSACTLELNSSGKYRFSYSHDKALRLKGVHNDKTMLKGYLPEPLVATVKEIEAKAPKGTNEKDDFTSPKKPDAKKAEPKINRRPKGSNHPQANVVGALAGTWLLSSWSAVWAVEFEGSADEFLYQDPTDPLPPSAHVDAGEVKGSTLSIGPDGGFSQSGQCDSPPVLTYDEDGVQVSGVAEFDGVVQMDGGRGYLLTGGTVGRLRVDDGDTLICDSRVVDGRLVRTVSVVTDGCYGDKVVLVYDRA